jgi:hypothetical protein
VMTTSALETEMIHPSRMCPSLAVLIPVIAVRWNICMGQTNAMILKLAAATAIRAAAVESTLIVLD